MKSFRKKWLRNDESIGSFEKNMKKISFRAVERFLNAGRRKSGRQEVLKKREDAKIDIEVENEQE